MGKRCIALICMIIVSITGCGGRDDSVLDFREQKKEMAVYTEADYLKERVRLEIIDVPKPEHAYVSAWTVYDELWLYDYQSGQLECISLEEMGQKFAYMLLDDLIILSARNGIWCIEPEAQTYTNLLLFGEEYSYGNIWHTLDGSACMQIDSSEEKISIAKINMME